MNILTEKELQDLKEKNKKEMFEILKKYKSLLEKKENKELKDVLVYFKSQQAQNEYTIKCLRNGINDLQEKNKNLIELNKN